MEAVVKNFPYFSCILCILHFWSHHIGFFLFVTHLFFSLRFFLIKSGWPTCWIFFENMSSTNAQFFGVCAAYCHSQLRFSLIFFILEVVPFYLAPFLFFFFSLTPFCRDRSQVRELFYWSASRHWDCFYTGQSPDVQSPR